MDIGELLRSFFVDDRFEIVALALILEFALGVAAAVKLKQFRLSYLADIFRNDILGKVLPWGVLYAGYKYAGEHDLIIPGVDLELLMNGAWGIVMLALGGSILKSITDLGLSAPEGTKLTLKDAVAGSDPETPMP